MKNKGFKVTAIILALAICIIVHPFSIVHALGPQEYINSGSGANNSINYRWDRYIWCSDPNESTDPIQVEVDGNTFWACEYTVFEVYFQNPANGTFRVNKPSGTNIGDYTFYVNGGIVSSRMTNYMTIKFTNVTHVKVVITTYNQTSFADPNSVFTLSNFSLSTPTDSSQTTLNDIDILLQNVDYTLQDILGYINGPNGIVEYLDQIETYSEYLQNISLDLSNIDNTIDTITWNTIPISYRGWTSDFSTFTTGSSVQRGGYYYFSNVNINANNLHSIFQLTVPLVSTYITDDTLRFGTYTFRGLVTIPVTEFMMYKSGQNMIIYFILDTSSGIIIENSSLILYCSDQTKYNSYYDNGLSLKYIDQNDIEYWTIRNAIYTHTNQKLLKQIVDGISDNSTQNSISDITDDLNDQIAASNSATSSTEALLDNFNQNIDLTDYNFSISTGDHVTYFRHKLTDIYDIEEFKPFYLIPIILFVLGRILAG